MNNSSVGQVTGFFKSVGLKNAIGFVGCIAVCGAVVAFFKVAGNDTGFSFEDRWFCAFFAVLGFILMILAARNPDSKSQTVSPEVVKVEITDPRPGVTMTAPFPVKGKCDTTGLREDHDLWIFTEDRGSSPTRVWPQKKIVVDQDGNWNGEVHGLGGAVGSAANFGVYLVGPDGQILINYFRTAGRKLHADHNDQAPGLPQTTSDIVRCATTDVTIGSPK
jgi:hypothetical protein